MTLPLFTGLRRDAQVDRSQAEVQSLRYQRREARSQLQSSIRQQTELTAAAYTGLREAEAAADAGAETVALVQESYAAGMADVLDLIDAQDALLQTRLAAANARRDLLLRLLQTERAVSRIGPLLSPAERQAFRSRLRRALTTPGDGRPSTPRR
jgi:outer membrane protein TolC